VRSGGLCAPNHGIGFSDDSCGRRSECRVNGFVVRPFHGFLGCGASQNRGSKFWVRAGFIVEVQAEGCKSSDHAPDHEARADGGERTARAGQRATLELVRRHLRRFKI